MQTRFRRGVNILGHSFCKNNGLIPIYSYPHLLVPHWIKDSSWVHDWKGGTSLALGETLSLPTVDIWRKKSVCLTQAHQKRPTPASNCRRFYMKNLYNYSELVLRKWYDIFKIMEQLNTILPKHKFLYVFFSNPLSPFNNCLFQNDINFGNNNNEHLVDYFLYPGETRNN